MIAMYAGLITLLGTIVIGLIAWYLATHTSPEAPSAKVSAGLYRIRFRYFLILVAVLVASFFLTASLAPYPSHRPAQPDLAVNATAHMWYWEISIEGNPVQAGSGEPVVIPAGSVVEFRVTSADVNHGFGLYNGAGQLLAQTQAMPGYVNRLRYRFDKPGNYRILCMEYCGIAHHAMVSNLQVK